MDPLEKFRLTGKTAVVTGGARGIGYAAAELMAGAGANIVLVDLEEELGHTAAEQLRASGHRAAFQHADLTNADAATRVADAVGAEFGGPEILVYCIVR